MLMPTKDFPSGRSLTKKGMATRAAILDTAHEVFKQTGYYGSSISEITRRCRVSMGTFYQYFKNKEQVFLELNDLIVSRFMSRAESLSIEGLDFEDRLSNTIKLLYHHTRDNFAFHRILGESELIDRVTIAYYESIARYYRNFLRREAQSGNICPLDPNMVAYGLIGICYFHSFKWGEPEQYISQEQLVGLIIDLLMNGISGPAPWNRPPDWEITALPEPIPLHPESNGPLSKGEKTRRAILRAGEGVAAQYGVNRANIAEITREAGVAQGTFYVHFESKRDLIEGFVKYINRLMRQELQRYVAQTRDRRDAERVGIVAFYEFLRQHREMYRIVPEYEMIGREVALWYYNKIAHGYIQGLEQGIQRGEIRDFPVAFLARSLMGLTHFIGLKWIIWATNSHAEIPGQLLQDIIHLVLYGLKTSRKE
jgi:AcrR family transcriptional regulator